MDAPRYIPRGYPQGGSFYLELDGETWVFVEQFKIKNDMTDDEKDNFKKALGNYKEGRLPFTCLKLIAAEPDKYDSLGFAIPAVEMQRDIAMEYSNHPAEPMLNELRNMLAGRSVKEELSPADQTILKALRDFERGLIGYESLIAITWSERERLMGTVQPADEMHLKSILILEYQNKVNEKDKKVQPIRNLPEINITNNDPERNKTKFFLEAVDAVNSPSHYNQYKGLEVIDITEKLNFNRGNAVQYISRAGFKGEDSEIQDLEKALWYVEREIKSTPDGSLALLTFDDVMALTEQMNFHRGNAVWMICLAGQNGNTKTNELTEATHSIRAEIKRLKTYKEN